MSRPPSGIEREGADEDVVILVADDGEALRVGPATPPRRRRRAACCWWGSAARAPRNSRWRAPARRWRCARKDAGLLGIVAGEEAGDLVLGGIEDEAGSQLDVATRPLFHEGCRKGQHGQDDDGRHEQCDAAEAKDDPQNAKFLKMFGSFESAPSGMAPCSAMLRSGADGGPPESAASAPVMGSRARLSRLDRSLEAGCRSPCKRKTAAGILPRPRFTKDRVERISARGRRGRSAPAWA